MAPFYIPFQTHISFFNHPQQFCCLCIFAILSIIVLNFSTSKVQNNICNILIKCEKIVTIFVPTFFILNVWQFNKFFIM